MFKTGELLQIKRDRLNAPVWMTLPEAWNKYRTWSGYSYSLLVYSFNELFSPSQTLETVPRKTLLSLRVEKVCFTQDNAPIQDGKNPTVTFVKVLILDESGSKIIWLEEDDLELFTGDSPVQELVKTTRKSLRIK
jgi:hypothetical protein